MTLVKHEWKQGRTALAVWTAAIGFFIVICVFMYPEMKSEMEGVTNLFASMGSFTAAFGMDRLNFGALTGFYAIECGNILGIGGAFFASLTAIGMLAKEEKERTAEFLLTHPVSRMRILTEKLTAVFLQITGLNAVAFLLAAGSIALIGETIPWKEVGLLHLAYYLVQLELAGICLGISAFLRRSGLGIGLGLATVMYFLNIIANLSEKAEFLKYITPFGYAEGADIITNGSLDMGMLLPGILFCLIGIAAAYWKYCRKDIL
ncbi:MAG: ABC transporter permease [Blautia sp.]|nr:ABC transporter permease [Blautia sp.]MDY5030735.1 ABC transporter permease subunit [Blautia sp.]